jgi:hypothetical protein
MDIESAGLGFAVDWGACGLTVALWFAALSGRPRRHQEPTHKPIRFAPHLRPTLVGPASALTGALSWLIRLLGRR